VKGPITQADREAMAKLFDGCDRASLRCPPKPDYGEVFKERLIAGADIAKLVAMIRGQPATAPVCTCRDSPFGMDVDRCPVHGEGCA
jgi:hypothetical protein